MTKNKEEIFNQILQIARGIIGIGWLVFWLVIAWLFIRGCS